MMKSNPLLQQNFRAAFCLRSICLLAAIAWPRTAHADTEGEFQARRTVLLEQVRGHLLGAGHWNTATEPATNRSVNDIGKHWWPRIFAELMADPSNTPTIRQSNGSDVTIAQVIRGLCQHAPDYRPPAATDPSVGYLYFSPVGLGWALYAFPDAIDERDKLTVFEQTVRFAPSLSALNMFTGQGTENHMLMGRTGGYLICQAIIRRGASDPGSGYLFPEATRRLEELKGYFLAVARSTYDRGLGEWDSSIYYPYVVSCWLGMNEYADDPEVRSAAHAMLDWIAATVALRTSNGVFGGAEQRGAGLQGSGRSNLDQLAWLWWGGLPGGRSPEWQGSDYGQLVYAAMSRYRPPSPVVNLALKRLPPRDFGRQEFETKPSYVLHGEKAVRQQTRVLFYTGRDYTLGAAIARPTGGWSAGDGQDMMWKLVANAAGPAGGAVVVGGPKGREPWRQVGMWKNVLFDFWRVPDDAAELRAEAMARIAEWRGRRGVSLRRAFPRDTSRENAVRPRVVAIEGVHASLLFSDGREVTLEPTGPTFVELGDTYLAISPIGAGLGAIPQGGYGGFVLEAGSRTEQGSFVAFQARIRDRDAKTPRVLSEGKVRMVSLAGEHLDFRFESRGTYVEPEFDWGYGADREGGDVLMEQPPFRFPEWPAGEGHGRVPTMLINDRPLESFFTDAVYAGPNLNLRAGVLTVTDGSATYTVDYSSNRPEFKSTPGAVVPAP